MKITVVEQEFKVGQPDKFKAAAPLAVEAQIKGIEGRINLKHEQHRHRRQEHPQRHIFLQGKSRGRSLGCTCYAIQGLGGGHAALLKE
jgi:hypothetical protein